LPSSSSARSLSTSTTSIFPQNILQNPPSHTPQHSYLIHSLPSVKHSLYGKKKNRNVYGSSNKVFYPKKADADDGYEEGGLYDGVEQGAPQAPPSASSSAYSNRSHHSSLSHSSKKKIKNKDDFIKKKLKRKRNAKKASFVDDSVFIKNIEDSSRDNNRRSFVFISLLIFFNKDFEVKLMLNILTNTLMIP
jgi:hypothetical protein